MDDSLNTKDSTGIQLYRLPDGRAAQVHFVHRVPPDLAPTMARYRAALRQAQPTDDLEQYVVVVGDGTIRRHDDPVHTGREFDLQLLYLKDLEPDWFLLSPAFTRLSRSKSAPTVSQILESVEARLQPVPGSPVPSEDGDIPERLVSLFFAGRFGPPPDLEYPVWGSDWAAALTTALALYAITQFEEVRRRIGRREGIADVLGDVLRERFGEHPNISPLAYQLAGSSDLDAVVQIITAATDLRDLYSKFLLD
jgi:hypothetical protein